jgi:DNA-binding CsgD family transcriptional regulator
VHLAQVYRVLGVTTRTAAVLKAARVGIIDDV